MKRMSLISGMVMMAVVLSGVTWDGSQGTLTSLQADAQLYKPPPRRDARNRIRNGTRSPGDRLPFLWMLAPDHLGLTVHEQPELSWYLSEASSHPVEVTVSDSVSIEPLFELCLKPPVAAGIHRTRLAEHGISLEPDMPYEWFVTILTNFEDSSQEMVTRGTIQRLVPSDPRQQQMEAAQLNAATKADMWHIYASAGIWYDALATLSALIETAPQDAALRQQRAVLFGEIGLPEVAAYSWKHP